MTAQKLESIIDMASVLSKQSDFQEILRLVTQKAAALFNAETALVMMINPSTRETVKTLYREGGGPDSRPYQLLHTFLSGWILEQNCGLLSENIHTDRRFQKELFKDTPVISVMCTPFRGDGIITGSLLLLNQSVENTFNSSDFDFLEKFAIIASPFLLNIQKIQQYFATPLPQETLLKKYKAHGLLGNSEKFIALLQAIEAASNCDVRVLLEGESGTGKELVAKAIHHNSSRASRKFIAIDCGAIPRDLIESELFGHVKGAFTGAGEYRKGLMEEANGGTLFMDEIANLPLDVQPKLLRVLQEKEIRPLGSNQMRKIDVRVIAASGKSLRHLVEQKEFREDLFYRLYVYPIEIPTLNQRGKDIHCLAEHFLKKFAGQQYKKAESFSGEVTEFLKAYSWTGNIRELENMVERLVTLAPGDLETIDISILPKEFHHHLEKIPDPSLLDEAPGPLRKAVAVYEKQTIKNALLLCDWNQSRAARMLEISEHSIRYKMKNLGITRQD